MSLGRKFGVVWSASALSNVADGTAFVSMPLLAASMTDDPRLVAGLATLYALVRLLVALPIGVWVDRIDRRTLTVTANLLRGGVLLGLGLMIQFGLASLIVLYVAMAVVGTLESRADSAAVAILPSLVRRDRLDIATAQLVADEFAGPPLGGLLFALAASAPAFAMGGFWAAAGVVALALPIHRTSSSSAGEPAATRPSLYIEAIEGIVWLSRHRVVGSLALIGALASVSYMLPFSVLVLFAQERLGIGGLGYGFLLAFSAFGGLAGSFLAPRVRERLGYRWTIVASLSIATLTLGGLALTEDPVVAGVLLALYILHAVVWSICAVSLRQRLVPDDLLGRVGATGRVVALLGLAAGATLGGLLAAINLVLPVLAGAAVFAACCLLASITLRGNLSPDGEAPDRGRIGKAGLRRLPSASHAGRRMGKS